MITFKPANRQRGDQVFRQTIGKVLLVLFAAFVAERQHGDGFGGDRGNRGCRQDHPRISLRCIRATCHIRVTCRHGVRPRRDARKPPQQAAADREQERENHDFRAADLLRAALAVIPRQHQHHNKADDQREDQQLFELIRPTEALRYHVEHLDQSERRGDVRERPLHQLALPEAEKETGHRHPFLFRQCSRGRCRCRKSYRLAPPFRVGRRARGQEVTVRPVAADRDGPLSGRRLLCTSNLMRHAVPR